MDNYIVDLCEVLGCGNVKLNKKVNRVFVIVVSIILVISIIFSNLMSFPTYSSKIYNTTLIQTDPNTMDSYKDYLLTDDTGSRHAGRIWADKSVFTTDITLDEATDGITGTVSSNANFLHVFSTLGSSQAWIGLPPTKTVIVIDNSGSMYSGKSWEETRMAKTIEAVNSSIDELMRAGAYNEVSVVVFGNGSNNGKVGDDHDTAVEVLKMGHYEVSNDHEKPYQYLDAGWVSNNQGSEPFTSTPLKESKDAKTGSGYVYVDKRYVNNNFKVDENIKESASGEERYDAYANGTTNINAGVNVALSKLLEEETTVKVAGMVFSYIPSVIMLTDGAATDMLQGTYSNPDLKDRGFTNDRGTKLASYIEVFRESKGKNTADWNMYMEIKKKNNVDTFEQVGYGNGNLSEGLKSGSFNNGNINGWNSTVKDMNPDEAGVKDMQKFAEEVRSTQGAMMLQTILNSSYMKAAVEKRFNTDCKFYTVSVDIGNPEEIELPSKEEFVVSNSNNINTSYVVMNPNKYFNLKWLQEKGYINKDVDLNNLDENDVIYNEYTVGSEIILGIRDAIGAWNEVKTNSSSKTYRDRLKNYVVYSEVSGLYNDMEDSSVTYKEKVYQATKPIGPDHSNAYLITERYDDLSYPNLVKDDKTNNPYNLTSADLDFNYVDEAYYTSTANEAATKIAETFDSIVDDIVQSAFAPIGGINDTGTSDSLTFVDPIGQYMKVKDQAVEIDNNTYDMDLLLFGKHHGMKKTAVYDYKFNNEHRGSDHDSSDTSLKFTGGWYDKDGKYLGENNGNWENGDVYYLDSETIRTYIPNLQEEGSMTEQQKNTVYTIYRFLEEDRNKDEHNPCYNDKNVTFKLSDIRVWVEDTENFEDDNSVGSPDLGFDRALYVNIPVNALPLQVANIEIGRDGHVASYTTNLDKKQQSTPFRLFYGVGVDDAIYTEDGLDIDLTKVSPEYLQKNKIGDNVYFYSNYYSNTTYDGYVTDSRTERTRGDAYFSFSPDTTNRYYLFQNPLPLYEIKEEDIKNEDGSFKEIDLSDENELKKFKEEHELITEKNKLSSDSYYYIVIDYFMPKKKDQVHVAVVRKGSEFGSGIAGGSIEPGAYLSWYNEKTEEWKPFEANEDKPTSSEGKWVIATRPGGLRVGDMAQSLQQKTENKTNTAYNSFLPTISSSSVSGEESNIIVNVFLGNNGRLQVNDSLLYVTKEVTIDEEKSDPDKEFNFKIKINGHQGDFNAIKMVKNPYSNEWQLRISTIDILTNNEGFLQDTNNNLAVYKDSQGKKYYVYIGENKASGIVDGDNVFRVYSAPDNDESAKLTLSGMTTYVNNPDEIEDSLKTDLNKYKTVDGTNTLGSLDIWVKTVTLVPTSVVDNGKWDKSARSYQTLSEFVVAHLDSHNEGANELTSPYAIKATYLTTSVFFGYDESNKPQTKPENWSDEDWNNQTPNVANFKLKNGEGLMFSGLKEKTPYEVEEVLSEDEQKDGYYLDKIELPRDDDARAEGAKVTGTVTSLIIDKLQYYNKRYDVVDLSISKNVIGSAADKNKDWTFKVKLTPIEGTLLKDKYKLEGSSLDGVEAPTEKEITLTKQDDGSYTGQVKLKHGQTVTIKDIQKGASYEITEEEANQDEYVTTSENASGTLDEELTSISFKNSKHSKKDIIIEKEVLGSLADKNKAWTIKLKLTPSKDFPLANEYSYTSSIDGEEGLEKKITLTKNEEDGTSTGTVKIKDGEVITIKDLPEDTAYEVTEEEANQDGYTTKVEGVTKGKVSNETENPNIKFSNMKLDKHDLKISKVVSGSAGDKNHNWDFTIKLTSGRLVDLEDTYTAIRGNIDGSIDTTETEVSVDKSSSEVIIRVSIKDGEYITIKDLPEGTTYEVTEDKANKDGYFTWIEGQESGTLNADAEVKFNNKKPSAQSITLSKEVVGGTADVNKEWTFVITLKPDEHVTLSDKYSYSGSKDGTIDFKKQGDESSVGEVILKHGESIVISGLPENTSYTVTEKEADQDGYTTKVTGDKEGTILDKNIEIKFTNIKLSKQDLTIKKVVKGDLGDKDKAWHFNIKLKDTILDVLETKYNYELTTKDNNKETKELSLSKVGDYYTGSFTLKDGEVITIKDLPEGTEYTVEEQEANKDDYKTEVSDNASAVLGIEDVEVTFTNNKYSKHDLAISKTVTGNLGEKDKDWSFKIVLTPAPDVDLYEKYDVDYVNTSDNQTISNSELTFTKQEDGTYTASITIKHGQTAIIKGLQKDTDYKVTEDEANSKGYITTAVNDSGKITGDERIDVSFQNAKYSNHNITIKKEVLGKLGDTTKDWTFNIKLIPGDGITLKEKYDYNIKPGNETGEMKLTATGDGSYTGTVEIGDLETVTIKDIPELTQYEVTEVEANQDGYKTYVEGEASGVLGSNDSINLVFKNTKYSNNSLVIQKEVVGSLGDKDKEWEFQVSLKPGENIILEDSYPYECGHFEDGVEDCNDGVITLIKDGDKYVGTVSIKHGQSIEITNLPENTDYEVIEVDANEDDYLTTSSDNTTGLLNATASVVKFTNTKLASEDITISKKVIGSWGDTTKDWEFKIILKPIENVSLNNTYAYEGSKEGNIELTLNEDGTYTGTFTLKHDETITIKGLPEGTAYEVTEVEANTDGYNTQVVGEAKGQLIEGVDNPVIDFKNIKLSKNSLFISKKVGGSAGDLIKEWNFTISLTPAEGVELLSSYSADKGDIATIDSSKKTVNVTFEVNENGVSVAHVKLRHGEFICINDIPEGTTYKVVEDEANTDNYITTIKGNVEGTLLDESAYVEFNNMKYSENVLTIKKVLKGTDVDFNKEWKFEVKLKLNSSLPYNTSFLYGTVGKTDVLQLTLNSDGVYVGYVTVKGGEQVSIYDIPKGTEYEVKEVDENKNGYKTTYSRNTGILDKNVDVTVVNERNFNLPNTLDSIFKYFINIVCSLLTIISLFVFIKHRRETV